MGPVLGLSPTRHTGDGQGARVPVAIWDGEDLVGVYTEESTARADAAVLQRDAADAGVRGGVDCLPLLVFTDPKRTHRDPRWTPPRPAR